jgi:hypothetical protein
MQMAAFFKWSFHLSKTATMAITTQILNTAMLNQRRITTESLSASGARQQFLALAGSLIS